MSQLDLSSLATSNLKGGDNDEHGIKYWHSESAPVRRIETTSNSTKEVSPREKNPHEAEILLPEELENVELAPLDIFEFFWIPEILHSLSENTNAYYAVQRKSHACRKWKPTTAQEIGVFLGLLIAMGVNRCKSPNDLWRKTSGIRIYVPVWKRPVSKAMGNNRFFQIKQYFHVSPPSSVIGPDNWWEKLEPLSSKMRESCKRYYLPSTSVTVDEMMIRFGGRSKHTVRMPNKPITEGYKVFAICDHGYTINWRFHSRVKGIGELSSAYRDSVGISAPTTAVVYQLAESSLPYREYDFVIYMNNLFSTVALFSKLRSIGIGACGTARLQAGRFPLEYNNNAKDIPWNTVVGGAVSDSNGLASVLAMQWQDNNHVHALSTIHTLDEKVTRSRKRPRLTSTSVTGTVGVGTMKPRNTTEAKT
ncbi:uncharacterized protein H6S33_008696 [Morchella sextelata]|uniref:uncharacterized protein n=1 Tax=Morchella sextelata TaxID=1174677 RepID=UPI001D03CE7F|nr:uncharacterized protein H6S33_008696 [Morchella sextelata]KAH0602615.1 hypothetical protein H6S33_008696 [Morchella sextelata]